MNPYPKTVSTLVVCALVGLVPVSPLCAGQSETTSSVGTAPAVQAASEIQSSPKAASEIQPSPKKDTPPPQQKTAAEASPEAVVQKPSAEPKTAAGPIGSQKRYVIGPLDVLYLKVWNQPQLSGPADVRPDGMLSMSLIGEVKADGLTAAQLKETIQTRLSDFLNNPEVDVQVAKVNSKRYFVYGGVGRPGEFPLIEATTIMDALSIVGGFKDFANPTKITIQRGSATFHFNYKDFSKGKNMDKNANIELQNGDRIYVPE
jgi:polysaccharide export outer membrane protein